MTAHLRLITQVNEFLLKRRLPSELIAVLSSSRIRKVGRQVQSDLKQLHDSVRGAPDFVGGLELSRFAKARNVVSDGRAGLSDLCAAVLHKCLRKNVSERLDDNWANETLSETQIQYAACDAFASLLIYNQLSTLPVPQPLPAVLDSDTSRLVLIYHTNRTSLIARGEILPASEVESSMTSVDGVNVTPSKIPISTISS